MPDVNLESILKLGELQVIDLKQALEIASRNPVLATWQESEDTEYAWLENALLLKWVGKTLAYCSEESGMDFDLAYITVKKLSDEELKELAFRLH